MNIEPVWFVQKCFRLCSYALKISIYGDQGPQTLMVPTKALVED